MTKGDVSAVVAEVETAWNSHDIARFGACFDDDADFVNVRGSWMRGRAEIEERHAHSHAAHFRNSTMRCELAAFKVVAPGVAVAHVRWELDGHDASGPRGTTETRRGIWTWTLSDVQGHPRIVAAQNTDELPPA